MRNPLRLFSKFSLLWLPLFVAALFVHMWGQASASNQPAQTPPLQWSDDFESYTPHDEFVADADIWQAGWTPGGYSNLFVYTDTFHSPTQSLKGTGVTGDCNASVAYHPIGGFAPMEIEVWVRNDSIEDRPLTGCHAMYGALELSTEPVWQGDHRGLISFAYEEDESGTPLHRIYGGGWEVPGEDPYLPAPQVYLRDFELETWYKVRIRYERLSGATVRLTYWINDEQVGQQEVPSRGFEGQLSYLGLWIGEEFAWFDDVAVYAAEEPPATAELSLTKTAGSSAVAPDAAFSYDLMVTNSGPADASNVVVTDELPTGVAFQSATPAEANCQEDAGTVTCNIGALAADGSVTISLNVTAPSSSGAVINAASVTHETLELDPADNTDTAIILVSDNPSSVFLPMLRKDG